jgi:FMN reductase
VKNLIELTGSAWEDKVVAFLNAAGGYSSYMSVMSVANSLMLDFRCVIVPRFVYAVGSAFRDGGVSDGKVAARIDQLANELVRFATRLSA